MEVKEENISEEEQQLQEKTIPVFTVLKNGAILKNIFVVNSLYFSSPERTVCDDNEVEEILVVGRHPDCDILLTHPSISRFHLEIRSIASRQKLFVTDLSSVHGTWVTDRRVEPHACVEVKEGDTIRIGGSTRIYRLHWIPLSRAYDIDNPFVSPFDASTVMEQEEENRMLETENLEVVHQSPENVASGDDRDLHLDVTSEGIGSSVPSEDDTYGTTRETWLPLASPSDLTLARDSIKKQKLRFSEDSKTPTEGDLDVEEAAAEKPSSSSAETDKCDVIGDGGLRSNVMSERLELEVPNEDEVLYPAESETLALLLSTDSIETEKLQLTENVQASPELAVNLLEANAENLSSGCSPSKGQIDGCLEASDFSAGKSAAELEILSHRREVSREIDFLTKQVMEASVGPLPKAEIRGHEASCSSAFELDTEVEIVSVSGEVSAHTDFVTKQVMEASAGPLTKTEIWSHEDNVDIEVSGQVMAVSPNSFPQAEPTCEIVTQKVGSLLLGSDLQIEVALETETENQKSSGETKVASRQANGVAAEIETENQKSNGESKVESRQANVVAIETESEDLNRKSNEESKVESRQASVVSDCLVVENDWFSSINTEDIQSLCLNWQQLFKSEFGAPSEIWNEMNPAEYQNQKTGLTRETEILFDEGSSSCLSEDLKQNDTQSFFLTPDQKPKTKLSTGSMRSEKYYSLSGIEGKENADKWCPISSPLAAETFEVTKTVVELETPSDDDESQENHTPQTHTIREDESSAVDSSRRSPVSSSACNIWSRRGKATSVLQIRTNKSEGKQKQNGNQPKYQLHRKQALGDKSVHHSAEQLEPEIFTPDKENLTPSSHMLKRLQVIGHLKDSKSSSKLSGKSGTLKIHSSIGDKSVHHSAEQLEPEIFTPDKENLTPSSHMLKRLQVIGHLKDSKSSSKLSGKSGTLKIHSSIAIVSPGVFTEPEIFTPDKENLTPNSHMLKRLREFGEIKETKCSSSKATCKPFFDTHVEENVMLEQKPNLHCLSNKSKVKHEPVEPKKKDERAPFQPLLENSLSRSLSYTEASCTASARNNISRGIRSTSILSDGKSKMKWTIVLDTSSLLDNDSRKPLRLLQGIKGTHMIVPRTVLRELNEVKRSRSLLFRRIAETASSSLDWIEDCKVNKKWWIQIQSPSEETKATAPTPPVTPLSNGSAAFPFSFHWSYNAPEIESPTSEDQVLECALVYRNRNVDEKLILLSNDETLKIKAMAEGVICETPHEFYESLANPFSERFMWTESTARGRTWSHFDDVVLRERYDNRACRKKPTYKGGSGAAAKGLKLILHHNSHYGRTH